VTPEAAKVIEAADAWARAMEAMAEAEERRDTGYSMEEFERTEFALFKAVVLWRLGTR
jgi:hypothetical protein